MRMVELIKQSAGTVSRSKVAPEIPKQSLYSILMEPALDETQTTSKNRKNVQSLKKAFKEAEKTDPEFINRFVTILLKKLKE